MKHTYTYTSFSAASALLEYTYHAYYNDYIYVYISVCCIYTCIYICVHIYMGVYIMLLWWH